MSVEPYTELIRKDVFFHQSSDTSSWPSSVAEFGQSIRSMLKIPSWFEKNLSHSDSVTQFNRLIVLDDISDVDIWDHDGTNDHIDKVAEQRLRVVFNTALTDCARIRAVIEVEDITDTPFPKESFLVILVRNAVLEAHSRLSLLDDVPVALPRHFSGAPIPILKYIRKRVYAPLVVSIAQVMPVEEMQPDIEPQLGSASEESTHSECGELFEHEPPTVSEWLDACDTPEESEDEQEDGFLSSEFEASFVAYPPSVTSLSLVHIPVLCMGDEDRLPVLMTSLLYQRRVWHISDPLVGLEFSKYSTTIRLFVGWLEEDLPSDRALPRVHLGEITTTFRLDLSVPWVALVLSRFLSSLESHICGVCNSVDHSLHTVISETRSHLSFPWRIDTDIFQEGSESEPASIPDSNNVRDTVIQWVESQGFPAFQASMIRSRKQDATSRSGSTTSSVTPQHTAFTQSIKNQESYVQTRSSASFSWLRFANTTEIDCRIFHWMFDRRVVPQSIPFDLTFRDEYNAVTGFIWPETWKSREDLPSVNPALEPCIQELLESVAMLKMRPGGVKCIPVNDFPADLRVLEQNFATIFQASRRSRENTAEQQNVCEAAWRHDHDRLLFDFFVRLVQPRDNETHTAIANHSAAYLEDPLSRPILEANLRLPKNNNLKTRDDKELQMSIIRILRHEAADLEVWLESRGISLGTYLDEAQHSTSAMGHWCCWRHETNEEAEKSSLSRFPCRGICDALGRLVVKLPNLPPETLDRLALVSRPVRQPRACEKLAEVKISSNHSVFLASTSKGKGVTVSGFAGMGMKENRARSAIPSSSACEVERLQLETDTSSLELPILAVEYKKASDGLMKGTNQLRMYLTASVKFLQAIGIMNTAVYGVQTDGPVVVLPAAIMREDKFTYLLERLVERVDISTPVGAWHYATILCRLAQNHARQLEEKFNEVRDDLVASLRNRDHPESWTLEQRRVELGVEEETANRV